MAGDLLDALYQSNTGLQGNLFELVPQVVEQRIVGSVIGDEKIRSSVEVVIRHGSREILGLPPHIVRAKGIFYFSDDLEHRSIYQRVGHRASFSPEPASTDTGSQSSLVVIGPAARFDIDLIAAQFEELKARA